MSMQGSKNRGFFSFDLLLLPDLLVHERNIYNGLDWIGDVGGFFNGLGYIVFVVLQIASNLLQKDVMRYMVKTIF